MLDDPTSTHPEPMPLSHEEASELLYLYAEARLAGDQEDQPQRFGRLRAHLAGCDRCRADLEAISALLQPVYAGAAPAQPPAPPNLARLRPPARIEQPWYVTGFGQVWVIFSEALLAIARPAALLGAPRSAGLLYRFEVRREQPDSPSWSIRILAERDSPETATVTVRVEQPHLPGLQQAGTRVSLHTASSSRADLTDQFGDVTFTQVPRDQLPSMRLAITASSAAPPAP